MTRRLLELTIEDVAGRAGVDLTYVRRLIDLGALGPEGDGFREQDVHVTALLHMWEDAGLTAESILTAVEAGELSLDFLESPGWELPPRLDRTYRQLAEERGMPVELLPAAHRSMGFVPPDPDDLAGPDDAVIASRTTTKNEGSQPKGNPEPKQQVSGRFRDSPQVARTAGPRSQRDTASPR